MKKRSEVSESYVKSVNFRLISLKKPTNSTNSTDMIANFRAGVVNNM